MTASDLVKIRIQLKDGGESFWAKPLGENLYRVENFLVTCQHIAPEDVVRCTQPQPNTKPEVLEVVKRGPWWAIGVIFDKAMPADEVLRTLDSLRSLGCVDMQLIARSFGIGVPKDKWDEAIRYLKSTPRSVGWEVVCGPDAPTPCSGPFDPPEDS